MPCAPSGAHLTTLSWDQLLVDALPVLGPTGLVAVYLLYQTFKDKTSPEKDLSEQSLLFQSSILKRLADVETSNSTLSAEIVLLNERLNQKDLEIQRLRYDLALMESAHQDLPIPAWMKDESGVMVSINRAYEELFLLPKGQTRMDYIGKQDIDIWGPEVAKPFHANDAEVFRTGRVFNGTEKLPVNGKLVDYHIIKYVHHAGGIKLGVAGIAIPPRKNLLALMEE